jgi:hypothetical protein
MVIRDILFIPCDFCSDVKIVNDLNYIVIENLFIAEHKKSYYHFNGQEYIDIIEKHVDEINSNIFECVGNRFILYCLMIFNYHRIIVPRKNTWEYKTVLNHNDDLIGLRFCVFYLNDEKTEVSIINRINNDIIKFVPKDGTTFIYNTQNYKLVNTNSNIKYITTIYNPLTAN